MLPLHHRGLRPSGRVRGVSWRLCTLLFWGLDHFLRVFAEYRLHGYTWSHGFDLAYTTVHHLRLDHIVLSLFLTDSLCTGIVVVPTYPVGE
jgi:hypothetical protein